MLHATTFWCGGHQFNDAVVLVRCSRTTKRVMSLMKNVSRVCMMKTWSCAYMQLTLFVDMYISYMSSITSRSFLSEQLHADAMLLTYLPMTYLPMLLQCR